PSSYCASVFPCSAACRNTSRLAVSDSPAKTGAAINSMAKRSVFIGARVVSLYIDGGGDGRQSTYPGENAVQLVERIIENGELTLAAASVLDPHLGAELFGQSLLQVANVVVERALVFARRRALEQPSHQLLGLADG